MARTDWEDHPTAYRARVTISATDPVTGEPLEKHFIYGPYGTKGAAKGQAGSRLSQHSRYSSYRGDTPTWVINGNRVAVTNLKMEAFTEQLSSYGKWEEV